MVTEYHGCFSLSRIIELANFSFSHGMSRIITVFLYPELSNYRIFLFTRNVTDYHGFSLSRIIELSNFSFSHGMSRIITVLLSFHTDGHGISRMFFFIPNYRISEFMTKNKSVILRGTPCEKKFDNSIIRDKEKSPCEDYKPGPV